MYMLMTNTGMSNFFIWGQMSLL